MNFHSSWPPAAVSDFQKCVEAHGGLKAWDSFDHVTLKLHEFKGMIPFVKGIGTSFQKPSAITVNPKKKAVDFQFPTHSDHFIDGKLIFSPQKKVIEDGRSLFKKNIFEKWRPEHALYFFGYAWANYIGYPFILPQFELLNWQKKNEEQIFKIRFPEELHTHSRVQTFYFDAKGLLYRHDYHADYAGFIFYGAHFTETYVDYEGVKISLLRKIRPRLGALVLPSYGLYAKLSL